jgi:hypothetical protein
METSLHGNGSTLALLLTGSAFLALGGPLVVIAPMPFHHIHGSGDVLTLAGFSPA